MSPKLAVAYTIREKSLAFIVCVCLIAWCFSGVGGGFFSFSPWHALLANVPQNSVSLTPAESYNIQAI